AFGSGQFTPDGPNSCQQWPGAHSTLGRGQGRPGNGRARTSPASNRAQSRSKAAGRVNSQPTGPSRPAVRPDRFRPGLDRMRPGEKEGCTWDRFKEMIQEKYYPTYYRAEMERQFLSLKQGTRTVNEYERDFTRLGAFVPDLVRTEAHRAQCFTDGLFPAVRHNIVGHGVKTYARTVSIAQELDASIQREANRDRIQPVAPGQSSTAPPVPPTAAQPLKVRRGKGKVPRRTGGPDRGFSRFHSAPLADDFTAESVIWARIF
ncbi:Unknown protein, partial [Striga hermonthica]